MQVKGVFTPLVLLHFLTLSTSKILVLNQLMTNAPHHIETSQSICNANQLTGFYVTENIGR